MDLEPAIIGILAAVFAAGAAAAIAAARSARAESREERRREERSPLNGACESPDITGRFAAQRVAGTEDAVRLQTIDQRLEQIHRLLLESSARDAIRGQVLSSLTSSVEMLTIQEDRQSRALADLTREIRSLQ